LCLNRDFEKKCGQNSKKCGRTAFFLKIRSGLGFRKNAGRTAFFLKIRSGLGFTV
jgi:hypothetical protein